MAALKPIKPTVCSERSIWLKICETVRQIPSEDQLKKAKLRSKRFSKVYKK